MRILLSDLRFSVRTLARQPGFTLVAVLVLALGIGLNTAIFSLVNSILLKPLSGDGLPGQVVGLYSPSRTQADRYRDFSYPDYVDVRDGNEVFSDLGALGLAMVGIGEGEMTRRQFVFLATSNFFAVYRTGPWLGRGFLPEEERPGAARTVAILSHEYWRKLGGDRSMVGRTIRINAREFTVIGIMPRGFGGPTTVLTPAAWLPTGVYELVVNDLFRSSAATRLADRSNRGLLLIGRLKPGTSSQQANASLARLAGRLAQANPGEYGDQLLQARRLQRSGISTSPQDDGQFAGAATLLMAMAAVVLLIACMNLANMLLARGSARRREIAIRLSLGGGRGVIVRQLLTEGMVLSLAGSAMGLLVTFWALRSFSASIDPMLPLILSMDPRPDLRVLSAALGFAVLSTLAFGLGPALRISRTSVVNEIKEGGRIGSRPTGARMGLRHALVVGQIALSLALLTAAGLFARGAFNASRAEPGFSFDRSVVVGLDPSLAGLDEAGSRDFFRRAMDRVRALPGVEAASLASAVPFGDFTEGRQVQRVGLSDGDRRRRDDGGGGSVSYGSGGGAPRDSGGGVGAIYYAVGRDYFETLGIPILRGRGLSDPEEQGSTGPRVVVIDEPLARKLFRGTDPIGQHIYFPDGDQASPPTYQVVGVAGGTRHNLFDREPVPHVYVACGQNPRALMHVHVRTAAGGAAAENAMLRTLQREVRAVDGRVPVVLSKTMRGHRDGSMSAWTVRAGARLFALFGGVAALLALVGVYGVRAYLVSRRTREIGLRMAVGATPRGILWLVLAEGLVLVSAGLAIGLLLALAAGRIVGSMLYEVSPFDPLVFAVSLLLLAVTALAACYVPARRATRIPPFEALRVD